MLRGLRWRSYGSCRVGSNSGVMHLKGIAASALTIAAMLVFEVSVRRRSITTVVTHSPIWRMITPRWMTPLSPSKSSACRTSLLHRLHFREFLQLVQWGKFDREAKAERVVRLFFSIFFGFFLCF